MATATPGQLPHYLTKRFPPEPLTGISKLDGNAAELQAIKETINDLIDNNESIQNDSLMYISPLGGGQDDWPTLISALTRATSLGKMLFMLAGTWVCGSFGGSNGINLPNDSTIIMQPGVIIESSLTPSGGQIEAVFGSIPRSPDGSADTTLGVGVNAGGTTLVLTSLAIGENGANVAVNDTILIGETNRFFYYIVRALDVGTKTVTLDRPLVTSYNAGVAIGVRFVPTNIRIYGNGATIKGTGDRAINLSAAYNCYVEDLIVKPNDAGLYFSDTPVAYDIGGRFSIFKRIRIDNNGSGLSCISLESCESCVIDECELRRGNIAHSCLLVGASYYCKVSNSRFAQSNGFGIWLQGGGGADIYGSRYNCFSSLEIHDCASTGVSVNAGSSFNTFTGCKIVRNGTTVGVGAYIGTYIDASQATRSNKFVGCVFQSNNSGDIQTVAGSLYTSFTDCSFEQSNSWAIDAGGDVDIFNCTTRESNSFLQVVGAANVKINGLTAYRVATAFYALISLSTTGKVIVNNVIANLTGASTSVIFSHTSGYLYIENILGVAATLGYSSAASANAKVRRGKNVDLSGTGTPYTFGAGSLQSWGSVVLGGGGIANIANTMVTADDQFRMQRTVIGAGAGFVVAVITPGVGIALTSSNAADTGTFSWDFGS